MLGVRGGDREVLPLGARPVVPLSAEVDQLEDALVERAAGLEVGNANRDVVDRVHALARPPCAGRQTRERLARAAQRSGRARDGVELGPEARGARLAGAAYPGEVADLCAEE